MAGSTTLLERFLDGLTNGYRCAAARLRCGSGRWSLLLGAGVSPASSYVLFSQLKSELAPIEDRGTIIGIGMAPEGSTIDYTDRYAPQ